jgi:hypothetical protein
VCTEDGAVVVHDDADARRVPSLAEQVTAVGRRVGPLRYECVGDTFLGDEKYGAVRGRRIDRLVPDVGDVLAVTELAPAVA